VGLDQAVNVREEQGCIVIEPVRRKAYKLDELLGGISAKNLHQLIDSGAPVGKEVW
jgi:antitoxin MazE